jgi:hypothetical protein
MFVERKGILVILSLLTACILDGCSHARKPPGTGPTKGLVPYTRVRAMAEKIDPDNVLRLRFYGPDLSHTEAQDPFDVTDPDLIRRFVEALRSAEGEELPLLNWADTLVIQLKTPGPDGRDTHKMHFDGSTVGGSYGPAFYRLLGVLEDYEAQEVRESVRCKRRSCSCQRLDQHAARPTAGIPSSHRAMPS